MANAKETAFGELYERLDTKEVEKDNLVRQRDEAGKYIQQVRVIRMRTRCLPVRTV